MSPGRLRIGMSVDDAILYAGSAALSRNPLRTTAEALEVLVAEVRRLRKIVKESKE